MPEVSNSPRLLLKNPSLSFIFLFFFSLLFFILPQITRVGPLLIVLCVTSHQEKRRRGEGKGHMKILKQATGMSTGWWESLFLIHISLFAAGSSSLAIYGILSEQPLLVPAQPQLEGWPMWLLLYFSGVGGKKP